MYDPKEFTLNGQVAVVTGAGARIGRAIAEIFASAGAAVMISDLDPAAAGTVAEAIRSQGGRAEARGCATSPLIWGQRASA